VFLCPGERAAEIIDKIPYLPFEIAAILAIPTPLDMDDRRVKLPREYISLAGSLLLVIDPAFEPKRRVMNDAGVASRGTAYAFL